MAKACIAAYVIFAYIADASRPSRTSLTRLTQSHYKDYLFGNSRLVGFPSNPSPRSHRWVVPPIMPTQVSAPRSLVPLNPRTDELLHDLSSHPTLAQVSAPRSLVPPNPRTDELLHDLSSHPTLAQVSAPRSLVPPNPRTDEWPVDDGFSGSRKQDSLGLLRPWKKGTNTFVFKEADPVLQRVPTHMTVEYALGDKEAQKLVEPTKNWRKVKGSDMTDRVDEEAGLPDVESKWNGKRRLGMNEDNQFLSQRKKHKPENTLDVDDEERVAWKKHESEDAKTSQVDDAEDVRAQTKNREFERTSQEEETALVFTKNEKHSERKTSEEALDAALAKVFEGYTEETLAAQNAHNSSDKKTSEKELDASLANFFNSAMVTNKAFQQNHLNSTSSDRKDPYPSEMALRTKLLAESYSYKYNYNYDYSGEDSLQLQ